MINQVRRDPPEQKGRAEDCSRPSRNPEMGIGPGSSAHAGREVQGFEQAGPREGTLLAAAPRRIVSLRVSCDKPASCGLYTPRFVPLSDIEGTGELLNNRNNQGDQG